VFAIDYTLENSNGVLCSNLVNNIGFQLCCENGAQILKYSQVKNGKSAMLSLLLTREGFVEEGKMTRFCREMLVLSHKKGENTVKVYFSNKNSNAILEGILDFGTFPDISMGISFGAERSDEEYINNGKGEIHWVKRFDAYFNDNECRRLASWPHEELEMLLCLKLDGDAYKPVTYNIFNS
jgi:hypothetical protein